MAIRAIVAEPLKVHGIGRGAKRAAMAEAMLGEVGLDVGLGDRRPASCPAASSSGSASGGR